MKDSVFVDAQEMAAQHPDTFKVPTATVLATVKKGSYVKICAEEERFWVKIERILDDKIEGVIDNNLVRTKSHGLKCYDRVRFTSSNIYQILE